MMDSQFAALEEPDADETDVVTVSISLPPDELVEEILRKLDRENG